jgi:hypothetical protein
MSTFSASYAMSPVEFMMPRRLHVAGPIVSRVPLMVGLPNANPIAILPGSSGITMTSVTLGSPSFVKPGDLVWFDPISPTPRTLVLRQLIVYKSMPLNNFVP